MATLSPGMTEKVISCKIVSGEAPLLTVLPRAITSTKALSAMRHVLFILCLLVASTAAQAAGAILVFGDSLSAGYGIRSDQSWPSLLDLRLKQQRLDYNVANLSISGETTAGGRARFDEAIRLYQPRVVIIALGANDGLRGLPLLQMRGNLDAMISSAQAAGAKILLIGMRMPPNFGPYANAFQDSFQTIARQRKVALLPFLLEPVATQPALFQADQLHPTAAAQPLLLDHVWSSLKPLLK